MKTLLKRIAGLSLMAVLSACGGGADSPPAPPEATQSVPPSASASALGLKNYLLELGTTPAEDKEPLDLGGFAPVADDAAEPLPLS